MYKGIVLDKMQRNAFLAMAANENLICEKGMTDGVFGMMTCRMPSYGFARMILEQFTVAGAVYVDPFTYRCLDGELIEKEIIMPYTENKNDLTGFLTFDIDMVQWMLAEKGLDVNYYTTEKIGEIFNEWKEKVKEFLKLEDEYKLDYQVVKFQSILKLASKRDYVGIDIDHFLELGDDIYHNPIFDVLKEYQELFNIAYYNDLLSPVINATDFDNAIPSDYKAIIPVVEGTEAVKILKYTSKRLNSIYTAVSLRDNVELVQTSEAKAYRSKVDEWLAAFSEQNYDNMQIIENDIVKAQKAIKAKKLTEVIGKVCATIGVAAAALTRIPPEWTPAVGSAVVPSAAIIAGAAAVSEIATYFGAPTAFLDPTKQHLWASFGIHSR